MTARERIAQQATDLSEVLAWGAAAEAANAGLVAERDDALITIAARDKTVSDFEQLLAQEIDTSVALRREVAAKDAEIATLNSARSLLGTMIEWRDAEITRLRAELALLKPPFPVYNEMKSTGHIDGWPDILVIYESELFPSSVTEARRPTTPPDVAYLDAFFANLFAQHGDVRLVLDSEAWKLITDVDSPTGINMTVVGWYVTLVTCAKNAGFTNVGLYGEITERATLYLNYPAGHETHELRKSNWQARNAMCQPIFDAVDTIYPSFYPIKPIHNDAAKRDAWMVDNLAICRERAPGKPVIPFLMARVHPSADETKPYLSGAYWLETVKACGYDGLVVYQNSTDPDPLAQSPVPDWHLETEAFIVTVRAQ